MKVLLTGAAGQLGYELQRSVPGGIELIALDRSALDISDPQRVMQRVDDEHPDLIINAAAYTAVDKAEAEPERAAAINRDGAINLARAAKNGSARLIQISTDFVFDGAQGSPYRVDAPCRPLSVYGATKLEGEQGVVAELPDAVIVRTSWLYSAHGNNFVKTMLRLMAERDELGIIADQVGSPTWAGSLARFVWQLAGQGDASGIYHWSDSGVASWYDFAVAIQEEGIALGLLQKPITIKSLTTADYPTPAIRPPYSVMDKTRSYQEAGGEAVHWRTHLRTMLRELNDA